MNLDTESASLFCSSGTLEATESDFGRRLCSTLKESLKDEFAGRLKMFGFTRVKSMPLNYYLNMFFLNSPGEEFSFGFDGTNIDPNTGVQYRRDSIARQMCHVIYSCPARDGSADKHPDDARVAKESEARRVELEAVIAAAATSVKQVAKDASLEDEGKKSQEKKLRDTLQASEKELQCMKRQIKVTAAVELSSPCEHLAPRDVVCFRLDSRMNPRLFCVASTDT